MTKTYHNEYKIRADKRAKFVVELVFHDDEKNIIEPSSFNFKSFYIDARGVKFEVSKNGNDFINSFIKDGKLYARFENHGLRTGVLKWQVILEKEITPDAGQGFINNVMVVPVTKYSIIELVSNGTNYCNCYPDSEYVDNCCLIGTENFVFPCVENIIPPITGVEIDESGELIITTPQDVFNAGVVKGEKGDTGEQGVQGEAGKDGLTTSITISDEQYNVDENGNITLPDYPDTSKIVINGINPSLDVYTKNIISTFGYDNGNSGRALSVYTKLYIEDEFSLASSNGRNSSSERLSGSQKSIRFTEQNNDGIFIVNKRCEFDRDGSITHTDLLTAASKQVIWDTDLVDYAKISDIPDTENFVKTQGVINENSNPTIYFNKPNIKMGFYRDTSAFTTTSYTYGTKHDVANVVENGITYKGTETLYDTSKYITFTEQNSDGIYQQDNRYNFKKDGTITFQAITNSQPQRTVAYKDDVLQLDPSGNEDQLVKSNVSIGLGYALLMENNLGQHNVGMKMGEYGTKLSSLQIGDTVEGGKKIIFRNEGKSFVSNATATKVLFQFIDIKPEGNVIVQIQIMPNNALRWMINSVQQAYIHNNNGWLLDSITLPEGNFTVQINRLSEYTFSDWTFDDAVANPYEALEINSMTKPITINHNAIADNGIVAGNNPQCNYIDTDGVSRSDKLAFMSDIPKPVTFNGDLSWDGTGTPKQGISLNLGSITLIAQRISETEIQIRATSAVEISMVVTHSYRGNNTDNTTTTVITATPTGNVIDQLTINPNTYKILEFWFSYNGVDYYAIGRDRGTDYSDCYLKLYTE